MAGLAGSAWMIYRRNFGSVAGPLWMVSALTSALATAYVFLPAMPQLFALMLLYVVIPTFLLSVALAVVTARLAAIEEGESRGFLATWSQLGALKGRVAVLALIPTLVTLAATWPPSTRLLALLLSNGILGPPLIIQAIALEGHSITGAFHRTKELLRGRGARTILYLVNVVIGTGLVGLFVGGALSFATRSTILMIVGLPVQTLVAGALLGYVACFEFVLFKHLVALQPEPIPG